MASLIKEKNKNLLEKKYLMSANYKELENYMAEKLDALSPEERAKFQAKIEKEMEKIDKKMNRYASIYNIKSIFCPTCYEGAAFLDGLIGVIVGGGLSISLALMGKSSDIVAMTFFSSYLFTLGGLVLACETSPILDRKDDKANEERWKFKKIHETIIKYNNKKEAELIR